MPTWNQAAGAATLQINASAGSVSGNSTLVSWSLYLYCYNGISRNLDVNVPWSVNIAGNVYSGNFNFDFRNTTAKLIASGSTWIGHDANGYAQIGVSGWKGSDGASDVGDNVTVSGVMDLPRIPKPPVTNGAPVVSNLLPTSAKFTWPANTNNNGAGIDQYLLRISKNNPPDVSPYTDYPQGGSTLTYTVTGLTPGTQYYATVYAHNSQGYAPRSATTPFKTLSGAYSWNGSVWQPAEVLVRNTANTAWVTGEVLAYNGTAWVPAT